MCCLHEHFTDGLLKDNLTDMYPELVCGCCSQEHGVRRMLTTQNKARHRLVCCAGLQVHKTMSIPDFLAATADLVEPVDAYFDKVFVMTDNEQVKRNRLALLRQIASLSEGILDFSQLPGF